MIKVKSYSKRMESGFRLIFVVTQIKKENCIISNAKKSETHSYFGREITECLRPKNT